MVVDFEVEVHVELATVFVDADVVDGHLVPLRDGPDASRDGLSLAFAGVGEDDDVGVGRDGLDPVRPRVRYCGFVQRTCCGRLPRRCQQTRGARNAGHGPVRRHLPVDPVGGFVDLLDDAVRRRVEEDIDSPLPQFAADEDDDEGDSEGGESVRFGQDWNIGGERVRPRRARAPQ